MPGVELKVMQELMRHSSLRSTLDVYAQAVGPAKQAAQTAVLLLLFPPEGQRVISRSSGLRTQHGCVVQKGHKNEAFYSSEKLAKPNVSR